MREQYKGSMPQLHKRYILIDDAVGGASCRERNSKPSLTSFITSTQHFNSLPIPFLDINLHKETDNTSILTAANVLLSIPCLDDDDFLIKSREMHVTFFSQRGYPLTSLQQYPT